MGRIGHVREIASLLQTKSPDWSAVSTVVMNAVLEGACARVGWMHPDPAPAATVHSTASGAALLVYDAESGIRYMFGLLPTTVEAFKASLPWWIDETASGISEVMAAHARADQAAALRLMLDGRLWPLAIGIAEHVVLGRVSMQQPVVSGIAIESCLTLLDAAPRWATRLPEMGRYGPAWASAVSAIGSHYFSTRKGQHALSDDWLERFTDRLAAAQTPGGLAVDPAPGL